MPLLQSSTLTTSTDTWCPTHACLCVPSSPRHRLPPPVDAEAQGQTGCSHRMLQSGSRICPVTVQDSVLSFDRKRKPECALPWVCPFLRVHSEQQPASLWATVFLISLIMFEIAFFYLPTRKKRLDCDASVVCKIYSQEHQPVYLLSWIEIYRRKGK